MSKCRSQRWGSQQLKLMARMKIGKETLKFPMEITGGDSNMKNKTIITIIIVISSNLISVGIT